MNGDDGVTEAGVSIAGGLKAAYALAWRACPGMLLLQLVTAVIGGMAPVGAAWLTKLALDEITVPSPRTGALVWTAAGLGALGIAMAATSAVRDYAQGRARRAIGLRSQDRLFAAVNRMSGLARLEEPRFHDRLRLAQQSAEHGPDQLVQMGLSTLQGILGVAGFLGTLVAISPLMTGAALAAAAPALIAHLTLSRRRAGLLWRTSPGMRRKIFYQMLLTDLQAAKEVRLFGLGGFLHGRMLTELRATNDAEDRLERGVVRVQVALAVLGALLSAGGLLWAVYAAATRTISVGDVSVFIASLAGLQSGLGVLVQGIAMGHQSALVFHHYLTVVGVRDDLPAPSRPRELAPLARSIELRDVWFRYGEDSPWVLRGLNLTIPHGTSLAVVGLNGAGKSTLVKLLCRFYDPQRGSVLWDGVDIRDVPVAELRQRIGAVFQDYMDYDLTAAENIGLGDLEAIDDPDRIRAAAERAGIHETVERLPDGYRTMLSRVFHAGEEDDDEETARASGVHLSGGQWQRLALARGLMRRGRDLMILDEPSSGLDAVAEAAVHDRLRELRSGSTSVLVSHRLSAVRRADRIVVVRDGQVLESGDHASLLASPGSVYAELFRTQAEGYQEDPAGGDESAPGGSGVAATMTAG
ncbi:ABC transporter ATP-binding protein [Nonomuraea roseoviolacea subsp. roseoviolacea]|uniref:ATP-binding cassette subfamily B protein n=1 Tax=Nonomuraea roseoviolacea subsp. carminata TaxID=160689 RepID=A0ABT1K3H6_9ACTN|nr:ABC transporter ATP-binding protein [Nonomuraea roseoviolacea]MCP2348541.1 ATP-binding cassette subfamily B protein [Nonomuraea roseoviolacea subsp. carminata]